MSDQTEAKQPPEEKDEGIQLPLKSVVLFIACGTMVFIIVFIFAKRQITRFALKSGKGPHVNIGSNGSKSMRNEIERRLDRISEVKYEPRLLLPSTEAAMLANGRANTDHFFYRMKAVDSLKLLDQEFKDYKEHIKRKPTDNIRGFLLNQMGREGPLSSASLDLIERFADSYEHARHDPVVFMEDQYREHMTILNQLIQMVRNKHNGVRHSTLTNTPDLIESAGSSTPQIHSRNTNVNNSENLVDRDLTPPQNAPTVEPLLQPQELHKVDTQVTYRPTSKGAGARRFRMTRQGHVEGQRSSVESTVSGVSNVSNVSVCGSDVEKRGEEESLV